MTGARCFVHLPHGRRGGAHAPSDGRSESSAKDSGERLPRARRSKERLMPGTIRKRGAQTWELRIELGRDPTTGKRRFRYKYMRGTKKAAEQALTEILHKRDTGIDIVPGKITVGEYME